MNADRTYDPSTTIPDAIAKGITATSGFETERVQGAAKKSDANVRYVAMKTRHDQRRK